MSETEPLIQHELDDDVLQLPPEVRATVSFEDDPTAPTLTFRYFVLTFLFVVPGAFLGTLGSYRTSTATYSVLFVQVASNWAGKWLAATLPNKTVHLGRLFSFRLNPGPWNIKENVLVTLSAASGATGNLGTDTISMAELFFNDKVNHAVAILYMWAIVWTGYSFAAIARNFLLYDPQFKWPQALMQTSLFEAFKRADESADQSSEIGVPKPKGSDQLRIFFLVLASVTIWQFFPELIFPMTSSLAVLCWVAPHNEILNFVGSGLGGMGVLNFTLDWSNITSSIMIMPYWTQAVKFVAFVFGCWVLIPWAKWGNLTTFKHGLMSNQLVTANGTIYPSELLITPDFTFNETAYAEIGPVYLGAQMRWGMFFDFACYVAAFTWLICFGYKDLAKSFNAIVARFKTDGEVKPCTAYTDKLNKMQMVYEEVPVSWFVALFLVSFTILSAIFLSGQMFMPWWTYLVALGFGAAIVVPMGWLYALSNFQVSVGSFNELLYGFLINRFHTGKKHPAGAAGYGAVAGDAWYRAQYMLQDQKIGHYMHIPPRAVFFSQIFGELIGVPVNYMCMRWVLSTKRDYLVGSAVDPLHQWTAQELHRYKTQAVEYVLLGPERLFALEIFHSIPYGFLLGLIAPLVVFSLYRMYPKSPLQFQYWNVTIFCSSLSRFYGNISTGPLSQFIGGSIIHLVIRKRRPDLYTKYNYVLAAALDTAFNLSLLLLFVFSSVTGLTMPHWWGNDSRSVERCFALKSEL